MDVNGLRVGFLLVFVIVGGANHRFMVPTLAASVAITQAATVELVLMVFGAWLIGLTFSSFMRH